MHLLCGLDDSAPGRNAASVAGALARRLDAALTLMHVVAGAPTAAESRGDTCGVPVRVRAVGKRSDRARATFGAIANDVAFRTGADVSLHIDAGEPADCLVRAVEELDADLLVIGHTRRERLSDMLLGEVHDRVLQRTSVPVVLTPAGATLGDGERIVLACRRSEAPQNAAELAGRLARRLRAAVVVAQVVPPLGRERPTAWEVYDAARRDGRAAATAGDDDIDVEFAEYEGDVDRTLAAVPEDVGAAFMVIGERRRTRWQRLLRASVASTVARKARHPVVVVTGSP